MVPIQFGYRLSPPLQRRNKRDTGKQIKLAPLQNVWIDVGPLAKCLDPPVDVGVADDWSVIATITQYVRVYTGYKYNSKIVKKNIR